MELDPWERIRCAYLAWIDNDMEYRCEYCGIQYQSEASLFQHVAIVHKVAFDKYARDNPHFAIRKEEEPCGVCGEWTNNIFKHLEDDHHKMATEVYFMRYLFCDEDEQADLRNMHWKSLERSEYGKLESNMYHDTVFPWMIPIFVHKLLVGKFG